jgi:gamma-D-glutamyl-L-lysine dipeptidyl-peptidase
VPALLPGVVHGRRKKKHTKTLLICEKYVGLAKLSAMLGICHVPIAMMYHAPSHKAELLSQLLAGEQAEVLEVEQSWLLVMRMKDRTKGWVDRKMLEILLDGEDETIDRSFAGMVKAPLYAAKDQYGRGFWLPGGAALYTHGSSIAVAPGRNLEDDIRHQLHMPEFSSRREVVLTALAYNGAPFLWGGKTIFGMDCSGLVQITFELNGIQLPRYFDHQVEVGKVVSFNDESQPGDLAFFENAEGALVHVGIIIDHGRIIHAYGEVRVDLLDHEGIFNKNTRQYTHKLRVIKNIID